MYGLTGMYSSDVLKTENPELTPGAWPDPIPCCPCLSVAVCLAGMPDSFDAIFTVGDTVQFKSIYTPPTKDGVPNYVHHFPGGGVEPSQASVGEAIRAAVDAAQFPNLQSDQPLQVLWVPCGSIPATHARGAR